MAEFTKVARVADIPDSGTLVVEIGERIVVLCQVDGDIYCIDDVCTHDGGPLSEGRLCNGEIACPRHGAKFDVRTGKAKTMPATQDTAAHDAKVIDGDIWVRLRDGESSSDVAASSGATAVGASAASATSSTAGIGVAAPVAGTSVSATEAASTPAAVLPTLRPGEHVHGENCQAAPLAEGTASSCGECAGPLSEDRVREELRRVIDPELFVNIVDLGLVYEIDLAPVEDGRHKVKIDMTMTSPMCPAGPQLIGQSKQVVGQLSGVESVEVRIVMDPPWTPDKMTDAARDQLGIF